MASALGHAVVGLAIVKVGSLRPNAKKLWLAAIVSSIIPDLDFVGFRLGVPYQSIFGHRGISHSIFFALVWSVVLVATIFRKQGSRAKTGILLFFATLSHGLIDAMTNGGLGVGFFIPFLNERYFFSFRPIEVSPISISRFFSHPEKILLNETLWIGLPCLVFVLAARPIQNRLKKYF